ncbi:hypothetical protein Mapa_004279 [Marchantia paleacea]|nr:hypothetical protein Mapa_004279 [Marchantia paleacea]
MLKICTYILQSDPSRKKGDELLLVQPLDCPLLINVIDPILNHPLESYNCQKLVTINQFLSFLPYPNPTHHKVSPPECKLEEVRGLRFRDSIHPFGLGRKASALRRMTCIISL